MRALAVSTTLRLAGSVLKEAGAAWVKDDASTLGAALAFYTIFSLAPVLIVTIAVAGLAFGHQAAEGEVLKQLRSVVGETGARAVQSLIVSVNRPTLGVIASAIGVGTVLIGASGAFIQLQSALDKIWKVKRHPGSLWVNAIRKRFFSFGLVLGSGFLLMVSLVLSAAMGALGLFMWHLLPGPAVLLDVETAILSFSIITLLLAAIFKYLPDAEVAWGDVWMGAAVASLLFSVGKIFIGAYLTRSTVASAYGAAASLVILLVWIYFSAQIVLLGAEVTHVYACKCGSRTSLIPQPEMLKLHANELSPQLTDVEF